MTEELMKVPRSFRICRSYRSFSPDHISLIRKLKHRHAVCRKRIGKRIFPAVAFQLFRPVTCRTFCPGSAEFRIVAVENQPVGFSYGYAYPVIFPFHRRKATDKQQTVFPVFALTDKTENTSFIVVCIDPLETVPAVVQLIHRRIFPVNMQKLFHIILHMLMVRILRSEERRVGKECM